MEATLYPQNQKILNWRLIVRVVAALVALFIIIGASMLVSHASRRARALETLADVFMIRTGLEQYYVSHAAYPKPGAVSVSLGAGEAMCLDGSPRGFQFLCTGEIYIAELPRSRDGGFYVYTATDGGYRIDFALASPVGSLADINRDGQIICSATAITIDCK